MKSNLIKLLAAFVMVAAIAVGSLSAADPGPRDGIMMKEGKMMVMKEGKVMPMTETMTCTNGTKVMADGTCMMADGKTMKMQNGDMMMMDGTMTPHVPKEKNK